MSKKKDNYTPIPLPQLREEFSHDPKSLLNKIPGIFLIDKPEGLSSHDIVSRMRKRLNLRKVGHGGTLDPMATGLLIIFAGNATRLFDELQNFHKTYIARMKLGFSTDSYDITGKTTETTAIPSIDKTTLEQALLQFKGEIMQTPPVFSAIKKNGKPIYELARKGIEVEIEPRPVTVHSLTGKIISNDEIELEMKVSKGFYVRSLIDDLGKSLDTLATMNSLKRTEIGPFLLNEAESIGD